MKVTYCELTGEALFVYGPNADVLKAKSKAAVDAAMAKRGYRRVGEWRVRPYLLEANYFKA